MAAAEPRRRWALPARIAIFAAALVLAGVELQAGIATWAGRTDPALAASIAPYDARLAIAAAQAAVEHGARTDAADVRRWVGTALARDATLPSAIELAALRTEAAGDGRRAARLFELSSALSRRSLPTRLWLIQRAVDRGDVSAALEDFDIALRTSANAPKVLFPVLARASGDPDLAGPIARVLDRPEDWRAMFLHYAITEAHAGPGMSAVVLRMRDRRAIIDNQVDQLLIGELVNEQQFALARRVQDAFLQTAPEPVQDADFSASKRAFPFGWLLVETGSAGAERAQIDGRPALSWQASPGGEGAVANQLLTLSPGAWRLTTTTAAASDSEAPPVWTLTCAETGGGEIARLIQPAQKGERASADFAVPADCPAQWLTLTLKAGDSPNRSGAIARVAVARR
jgi:hypothetical protein